MVKLRLYFFKCNCIKSPNIKAANAKSKEQWGREVCSFNMYPMLSDNENWCLADIGNHVHKELCLRHRKFLDKEMIRNHTKGKTGDQFMTIV